MRTALLLALACVTAQARPFEDRWFYWSRNLSNDQQLEELRGLCATAAQHGYNGLCWAGAEGVTRWPAAQLARLEQAKQICAEHQLEIIPLLFSAGYGGAALGYDKNLAVGFPVEGARFQVAGGVAKLVGEPVTIKNPGFETLAGTRIADWPLQDGPGTITFQDREVKHSGEASVRFENPGAKGLGSHARVMQEIAVQPRRHYRMRLWVKADQAEPVGTFRIQLYGVAEKSPNLVAQTMRPATFDWRPVTFTINSQAFTKVRLYLGSWEAQTGRFWVDDVEAEELGLVNILRRDGCPLKVTSEDGATVYEEGRDFAPVADPKLLDTADRPGPDLTLLPGSRLRDGQTLQVSWYHAARVADNQVSVCMSAPGLYEHYEAVAKKLAEVLPSRKFLLSMDEIRQGGTDRADLDRGLTMAQILGDCVTRQQQILRRHHPGATCYIWSDMLDPGHNAHGDYYMVNGDFTGAVDYVPQDLVIACWYGRRAKESLAFFAERGFRTLGAAYYDAPDLAGSRGWLEALAVTPRATGIMYTTWQNKYELLAPFGDLVRDWP